MTTVTPPDVSGPPADDARQGMPSAAVAGVPGRARWRPWHGRPGKQDLLCVAAIMVSAVYSLVTIPLTPALIATHPITLELLTGTKASVVAAGSFADVNGRTQLVAVVAAALPGMMRFDWVYWWAGRLWGHRMVERLAHRNRRAAALAARVERRGVRFAGPLVAASAFLPGGSSSAVYAAAGWTGLRLLPFVLFDMLGTALWSALLAVVGYLLGPDGVRLADLVSRYATVTICVLAAAAFLPHLRRLLRRT